LQAVQQETTMAHPDPQRQGSEKGQREHAGPTSARSDAGLQSHSQNAHGAGPQPAADPTERASGARDAERGRAAPQERSDAAGTLPEPGMDRDAGAGSAAGQEAGGAAAGHNTGGAAAGRDTGGAAAGRDAGDAPAGHARDLERGGQMAQRGLDVSGDPRARGGGRRPQPPRGGRADR
jgi:hypothetical protein